MKFSSISDKIAHCSGHPLTVAASFIFVLLWAAAGPYYGWSDGHQLFVNTVTTVITFWLVFVIQATQNRDTLAIDAKLDELIRSSSARNEFIGIDRRSEEEVARMRKRDDAT
jgi:low affinity Fe/Cu permease